MLSGLSTDFVLAFVLLDIAVILVVARLLGGLATRVGQPRVVGEIVAGVLLGPSLLGATVFRWDNAPDILNCDASRSFAPVGANPATFVPRAPSITECLFPLQSRGVLSILGQIALVLFMFLVGMELDFKALAGKVKGILVVSISVIVAPILLGLGLGSILYTERFARLAPDGNLPDQLAFSLFLAAMLAVTAFPVMARILQEKGLATSPMGAIGIASAAVVTVLMFILLAVARGVSKEKSVGEHSLVFIGTVIYLTVMFAGLRPLLGRLGRRIRERGVDGEVFAIVALIMFASAFAADRIGINVIVGGFVAGAVMPERGELFAAMKARLGDLTNTVLLPIFLAFSGLRTDFTTLGWAWIPGLVLFVVAGIVAKWGAGIVSARLGGLTWAEGNVLGVLMNCRGLLVLVVALAAADAGIITPQMQLGGVLMALVTTAMTGPLFDRFIGAASAGAVDRPTSGRTVIQEEL
jgi:Kef-type K+ transport system membrane component KefB